MARQRFVAPVINLPVPPAGGIDSHFIEIYTRQLVTYLTQQASPGVFRVHEIDMVEPIRAGGWGGSQLPTGAVYVDGTGTLKMVLDSQIWAVPVEVVVSGGGVTLS